MKGETITYEAGMAQLAQELRQYLAYTSKTVEEAIAHTAQGVVLGRGGNGFGKRREGLYGLTRALAFKSRDEVDRLFEKKKFNVKRIYTAPGSPLVGANYGGGKSALGSSPQAGPKMYRSGDPKKYSRQRKYMLANDILISNRGDKLSASPFTYTRKKDISYATTESQKRYRSARFLSVGWLPAVKVWKRAAGDRMKTESLKANASKFGSIEFSGKGMAYSVVIRNHLPGFSVVDKKYGIIGRALSNVAADIRDYLNKRFSIRKNRFIRGNPVTK